MFRIAGLATACVVVLIAGSIALAQETSPTRRSLRAMLSDEIDKIGTEADATVQRRAIKPPKSAERPQRAIDRARDLAKTKIKTRPADAKPGLAELGAQEPFAYAARSSYLVAAVRDGEGLALWETKTQRRLHRLENSDRQYSLVSISEGGRWIAAVRQDDGDQIDLWRADSGGHVRTIRASGGPKQSLAFDGGDELRVVTAGGESLAFDIPSGAAVGGSQTGRSGTTVRDSSPRVEGPRSAMPAAPSTSRSAPTSRPPVRGERGPSVIAQDAPQGVGPVEPRIPTSPSFAEPKRATSRVKSRAAAPAPRIVAPPVESEPAFEPAAPLQDEPSFAAPAVDEPSFAAPSPQPAQPSFEAREAPESAAPDDPQFHEPSGGSAPEPTAEGSRAPATAEPAEPVRSFRFEMDEPPAVEPQPAAAEAAPADESAPETTIDESAAPADAEPRVRAFRFEADEPTIEAAEPPVAGDPPVGGSAPEMTVDESSESTDEVPIESDAAESAPAASAPAAAAPRAAAPRARQFRFEIDAPTAVAPPLTPTTPAPAADAPAATVIAPAPTAAAPAPAASDVPPALATAPPTVTTDRSSQPAVATPLIAEKKPPTSVRIHYATNRNRLAPTDRAWSAYFVGFFGSLPAFIIYALVLLSILILPWFGKRAWAASALAIGAVALCVMGSFEAYVRSQLRDEMTGERFGCRPTDLSYGSCEISLPPPENRRPGDLSRPVSVWVFEAPENPDKHFMLRRVEEHKDKDEFYRSMSTQLAAADAPVAMLFIHGYNASFEDAIFRTAQLAVDLKFPGAPMTFCWPSYADPVKYPFDEQNAEVSIPALREVLDDLATRSGARSVHIIAHSMGNRVLAGALRSMDSTVRARNKEVFRELVLAAPDIDSRVFRSQVLPHIVENTGHCTLYASSRDRALLMSRCFHNYQRLGETQPELVLANGLDTIDASLVDTSLLGHSYIGDVQSIVADLHDLVVGGKRASERLGLQLVERNTLKYWSIVPEVRTATDVPIRR